MLCLRAVTVINVVCIQAHSLIERIHDVDLLSLDAKSVAEVRQFFFLLAITSVCNECLFVLCK